MHVLYTYDVTLLQDILCCNHVLDNVVLDNVISKKSLKNALSIFDKIF